MKYHNYLVSINLKKNTENIYLVKESQVMVIISGQNSH